MSTSSIQVSPSQRDASIRLAKRVVRKCITRMVPPYERLWAIAKVLGVASIEPGAVRTDGFLKKLPDSSYAIYYDSNAPKVRRRYTVAHELGHLVLDRFVPHISDECIHRQSSSEHTGVEKVVDRIAAELLMPSFQVVRELKQYCDREQKFGNKIETIDATFHLAHRFGVSRIAMTRRLLELNELLAAFIAQPIRRRSGTRRSRLIMFSEVSGDVEFKIIGGPQQSDPGFLEGHSEDKSSYRIVALTDSGERELLCSTRTMEFKNSGKDMLEYWTIGWAWNFSGESNLSGLNDFECD